jgi:methionine synthase II (cobalamin-independent)
MIAGMEKAGVDHEALLDTYIRAINVITQGRPEDLTISVHMCRGNFKVAWTGSFQFLLLTELSTIREAFTFRKEDMEELQ